MTQERKAEHPQIACQVSTGLFSNERGVLFNLPDGTTIAAFVDKSQVSYSGELVTDEPVSGLLDVRVVEVTPEHVLIDIPGEDIVSGSRIKVPREMLRGVVFDSGQS